MRNFAATLICLALGCSGGDSQEQMQMMAMPDMAAPAYSCDAHNNASVPNCQEWTNVSASQSIDQLQGFCAMPLAMTPCSHTDSLGGCKTQNANYTYIRWFYSGTTYSSAAMVMTVCSQSQASYVPPG